MVGFGAKKQILLVGNDGVQLYVTQGKRVSLHTDFSASTSLSSDLRKAFKEIGAPLTIAFDVVEQQYRRETLPKVGFMDKSKVIKRKLLMAFPQQQLRAFMPLAQKARDEGIVALFVGLAFNLTITQIMDAVLGSEVTINGAVLLPMESTTLVKKLSEEAHKRSRVGNNTRWTVLITHHKTGGLRQIVIKDGELALTRMTPLVVDPANTQGMAEEITREFSATQTYLSRFGYIPNDGLDLILVTSKDVCDIFRDYRLQVTNFYAMTVQEAGQMVGISPFMRGGDHGYGEILHAGWIGVQRKLLMPLSGDLLDKIKKTRQMAQMMILVAFLAFCYVGWQSFNLQADNINLTQEIVDQKSRRIALQVEHDNLSKQLNTLKYEPEQVRMVLDVYNQYSNKGVNIEPTLKGIIQQLNRDKLLIKAISFEEDKGTTEIVDPSMLPPPDPNAPPPKPRVTIKITLSFMPNTGVEEGARLTNEFADKLRTRFPNRLITIDEMVGNLAVDKTVQGISEQVAQGRVEGRLIKEETSVLTFKGEIE